jgi:PQQ-like domain
MEVPLKAGARWMMCVVLALLAVPAAAWAADDWTTWGDSPTRSGRADRADLAVGNAGTLRQVWSRSVDSFATAQALYLSQINVQGQPRDLIIAGTQRGTLYAFDERGQTVWKQSLGATRARCTQLPGGYFGITSSPTYDRRAGILYVVSDGKIYALDPGTGSLREGWPVALPMRVENEHVWGALAQRGPYVYAATAAYCDRQPWKGRLIRVDVRDRSMLEWQPVPTSGENGGGGMWGWGGAMIDPKNGHVWVATANAAGPDVRDDSDFDAEAVVELTPDLRVLHVGEALGMPTTGDYGFGSTPVFASPTGCPRMVVALGKDGIAYVWRRDNLERGPVQRLRFAYPATLYGVAAWDVRTQFLFATSTAGLNAYPSGLTAFRFGKGCQLERVWSRPLGELLNSTPTISRDIVAVTTGSSELKLFSARWGAPLRTFRLAGPGFAAPTVVGRYVIAVSTARRIHLYRLG